MGYGNRHAGPGCHPNHTIRTYWPDDDETTMYIDGETKLSTIIERIRERWPGEALENFQITSDHIHTDCLGYDLYDANDWTNFIIIEKIS